VISRSKTKITLLFLPDLGLLRKSQTPYCEGTKTALSRRLPRRNSPPVNKQHQLASHVSKSPWTKILYPIKPVYLKSAFMDILTKTSLSIFFMSWGVSHKPEPHILDPYKLWRIMDTDYCLKPLSFGVICHTAIVNKCTPTQKWMIKMFIIIVWCPKNPDC